MLPFNTQKTFSRDKRIGFLMFLLGSIAVFLMPDIVSAASPDLGMEYGSAIGLPNTDPRLVVARLIQIVLGFLGIIALVLIIYGGFLWMTSAGNPEKIDKAKKVLRNTIIGLIIILASFGITTFVLNKMMGALGGGTTSSGGPPGGSSNLGVIGSCITERVYPEPGQEGVPRNTSIMVTFKEAIDPTTVCDDANGNGECDGENIETDGRIRIYKRAEGLSSFLTDVQVTQTSDDKTFVFTPEDYLGSASEYVWYGVKLSNDIEKQSNGQGAFSTCQQSFLQWHFQVSNELDLTPPQVKNIFPPPDDQQDEVEQVSSLSFATGEITFNNTPETYDPASVNYVSPQGSSPGSVTAEVEDNCEQQGTLMLAVESDGITASLKNQDTGNNLGAAQFDGDTVSFDGILDFTVDSGSYDAGNSWEINVDAVQYADTLTVGNQTYVFSSSATALNEIQVDANTVSHTAAKIDSRDDLVASSSGNTVNIRAQEGGSSGNNIDLEATEHGDDDFAITPMSGGEDEQETINVKDRKDQPKNAIIQVNFNEAMNPVTAVGGADEVSDYIRVVNASSSAGSDGASCSENNDCLSFNCNGGTCSGNYLSGEFLISNNYQTLEFQSDNKCGTNACGEDIYCLPENANIKVEMEAASLAGCGPSGNCSTRPGYNTCTSSPGSISGDSCADSGGLLYPLSYLPLDGLADAAMNSLDGNKDGGAVGPIDYYNVNIGNTGDGDNYTWSFWTNDKMEISPPVISDIDPSVNGTTSDLTKPVQVDFNKIMKVSSLTTGKATIDTGNDIVEHQLINLWNFSGDALGYWITAEGIEEPPMDGYPDRTNALVKHSMFGDSMSYRTQVGSGVKDIYQNCYKPSDGPSCSANSSNPSCCNGTAVPNESCSP